MDLTTALMLLPGLVIGLSCHEAAHALSASLLGDDFPRRQGRVSLNPFRHLSLLGTLAIFLLPFGWARPVQVNLHNFRHPKRDYLLSSLAGPAANLLIVAACLALMQMTRRSYAFGPAAEAFLSLAHALLTMVLLINAILATLNLLPLPPLDGSKIWVVLIPGLKGDFPAKWQRISILLLLVLLWTDSIDPVFHFVFDTVSRVVPEPDAMRYEDLVDAGRKAREEGNTAGALRACEEALAIHPRGADAHLDRALLEAETGDPNKAIALLDRAEATAYLWPGDRERLAFVWGCALLECAYKCVDANDFQRAEAFAERAVALGSDLPAGLRARAMARLGLGRPDDALSDANRAVALDPNVPELYELRAAIWQAMGKPDQAAADAAKAKQLRARQPPRPKPASAPAR